MAEKTPRGMLDGPGDESEQSDHSDQSDRSEMSRPGGKRSREGSPNHSQCSLREMCKCVYSKLGVDVAQALPVKAHKSAVSTMTQIQELLVDRVQRGEAQTPRDIRMYLLYSGVALRRRLLLTKLSDIDESDLRTTLALLFVLQLLCHGHAPTPSGDSGNLEHGLEVPETTAGETDSDAIEQWKQTPLEDIVNSQSGWQTDSATVCQSCLSIGPRLCTSMTTTVAVAEVFFRCSADMLRYSMLGAMQPSDSFLRLDSVDFLIRANRSSQNLSSIVELAESEAGQTVCLCALHPSFRCLSCHCYPWHVCSQKCTRLLLAASARSYPLIHTATEYCRCTKDGDSRSREQPPGYGTAPKTAQQRARSCYARGNVGVSTESLGHSQSVLHFGWTRNRFYVSKKRCAKGRRFRRSRTFTLFGD